MTTEQQACRNPGMLEWNIEFQLDSILVEDFCHLIKLSANKHELAANMTQNCLQMLYLAGIRDSSIPKFLQACSDQPWRRKNWLPPTLQELLFESEQLRMETDDLGKFIFTQIDCNINLWSWTESRKINKVNFYIYSLEFIKNWYTLLQVKNNQSYINNAKNPFSRPPGWDRVLENTNVSSYFAYGSTQVIWWLHVAKSDLQDIFVSKLE